jgi:hypothetical protein
MNWFLNSKDAKDFKLNACQVVEHVIEFYVLTGRLDSFIDCDDKLISFLDSQLTLGVHDGLDTRRDEELLKLVQVLEIIFFVYKVVFQRSD